MDTFRTGYVYVRNIFAGILAEIDEGYSFSYDSIYNINTKQKNGTTVPSGIKA